jgi:hypothetical protein
LLAKAAKTLGFWFARSRLFPAVPGTRGRKWIAATGEGTAGDTLRDFTSDVQALELILVASR